MPAVPIIIDLSIGDLRGDPRFDKIVAAAKAASR
jgi:hypothetical protein